MEFRYYTMAIDIATGVWLSRTGENDKFLSIISSALRPPESATSPQPVGGESAAEIA